jgi:XTP/dITP diphosphohydrolase
MRIVLATGNRGKIAEMCALLSGARAQILSQEEAGVTGPPPLETGSTFEENALIKARSVFAACGGIASFGGIVIADDSGLAVDALNGAPGVHSARYAAMGSGGGCGGNAGDLANIQKLLRDMESVPDERRTARFVSAIACISPDGSEHVLTGCCEGVILHECVGNEGFGYDPVFYLPRRQMTFAQLPPQIKNELSHRAVAMNKLRSLLDSSFPRLFDRR